jgi:hypothetical protein
MAVHDFSDLFMAAKASSITYGDKTLILMDEWPARLGERFLVTIESTDSIYPQGVGVCEGVEIFGMKARLAVIWEYFSLPPEERASQKSRLPFSFEVVCRNKQGYLRFYNMSEVQGRQERHNRGSCMYATEISNGRRYYCNDFDPDDDFNDLVFSVVKVDGAVEPIAQPNRGGK